MLDFEVGFFVWYALNLHVCSVARIWWTDNASAMDIAFCVWDTVLDDSQRLVVHFQASSHMKCFLGKIPNPHQCDTQLLWINTSAKIQENIWANFEEIPQSYSQKPTSWEGNWWQIVPQATAVSSRYEHLIHILLCRRRLMTFSRTTNCNSFFKTILKKDFNNEREPFWCNTPLNWGKKSD